MAFRTIYSFIHDMCIVCYEQGYATMVTQGALPPLAKWTVEPVSVLGDQVGPEVEMKKRLNLDLVNRGRNSDPGEVTHPTFIGCDERMYAHNVFSTAYRALIMALPRFVIPCLLKHH